MIFFWFYLDIDVFFFYLVRLVEVVGIVRVSGYVWRGWYWVRLYRVEFLEVWVGLGKMR